MSLINPAFPIQEQECAMPINLLLKRHTCGILCEGASHVYPVFVLDPWFLAPDPTAPSPGSKLVGVNRIRFLLQSLEDLDENLRKHGSRLLVLHGNPTTVIPELLMKVNL